MLLGVVGVWLLRLQPVVLVPPRPRLLPLEFVQLDQQVVYVVQVLDFVHLLECVDHGDAGDVENVDDNFYNSPKEVNAGGFVVLLVEDVEVDVSEVDDEEMHDVLLVGAQFADDLLLLGLAHPTLALAQLQLPQEQARQLLYLFDLRLDLHLHDHQFLLADVGRAEGGGAAVEVLEGVGDFGLLGAFGTGGVELVDFGGEVR